VSVLRRLDHVAVLVRSTDDALRFYRDHLGLAVHSSEEIPTPPVRLTYLDAGNAFVQLVEPLESDSDLAKWLEAHGEGLHHICFGVDDVARAVSTLSEDGSPVTLGTGRGRASGFVTTSAGNGVRIECTEFDRTVDVENAPGWLP
jgi:methylmalonyl-CoA/ethylmalonyl-CoA epimerase